MGRPPKGKKNEEVENVKKEEVLEKVSKLNLDGLSNLFSKLQVELQEKIAEYSGKAISSLSVLKTIEEAISMKRDELKSLRDIEVTATTLDALEMEIKEKREAFQSEIQKIEEERERDEADFIYNRELTRKKENDAYLIRKEALERDLVRRADEMKLHETELSVLRQEKANFEAEKTKAVAKEVAIATAAVTKEYNHKTALSQAEMASEKKLLEQSVKSLQDTVQDLKTNNESLRNELSKAQENLKDLATQTVSGAAYREAMNHTMKVQETAAANTGGPKSKN